MFLNTGKVFLYIYISKSAHGQNEGFFFFEKPPVGRMDGEGGGKVYVSERKRASEVSLGRIKRTEVGVVLT